MKGQSKAVWLRSVPLWLVVVAGIAAAALIQAGAAAKAASPPQPTYGSAVVDGNPGEWNLAGDFFANMHRAGDPSKKLESKLYLRYSCSTETMFALVLVENGVLGLRQDADSWLKIGGVSGNVVDGADGNDGTPPDFQYVEYVPSDPQYIRGYEASFSIAPGTYTVAAHIQVFDDSASQTSATGTAPNSRFIPLVIECDDEPPAEVELQVTKTAATSYTTTCTWDIDKSVDNSAVTLKEGDDSTTVNYAVTVSLEDCVDSDFKVSGKIIVTNTGDVTVTVTAIDDILGGDDDCDGLLPAVLGPSASLECDYEVGLPAAVDGSNTASASGVTADGVNVSDESPAVDYSFSDATVHMVDECVTVSDTLAGDLGVVCKDQAPAVFQYSATVGPYADCGTYTVDNTASFATNDTGATGSDAASVSVTVLCKVTFCKAYDSDADGHLDAGEPALSGWEIAVNGGVALTEAPDGCLEPVWVAPGSSVSATESLPTSAGVPAADWMATNGATFNAIVSASTTHTFLNVCKSTPGGHTLGFWSNKRGQSLINEADLAMLRALHLRNADGTGFDPITAAELGAWLTGARATNMANMLSAQLAATVLSVRHGFTDADALVDGTRTVQDIIDAANAALGADGLTLRGNPNRGAQEMLKDILDKVNNGGSFILPPGTCTYSFS